MARDAAALIEKAPGRLSADYVASAALTGVLLVLLWRVGHLDPVGDTASRRIAYGLAGAGGLGLAWAVYTWIQTTYSDSSPRMVRVRARQGLRIRTVRYRLMFQALVVFAVSLLAVLIDVDGTWRVHVFYLWLAALIATGIGLWRALRLTWRLNELRDLDDKAADDPPRAETFTWRRSA